MLAEIIAFDGCTVTDTASEGVGRMKYRYAASCR